ncbi:MAG: energy transducer TonB [Rhodothermales bacterium]
MPAPTASRQIVSRIRLEGKRPCDATLMGHAPFRMALGWTLALLVTTLVFRIPWAPGEAYQGWRTASYRNDIELQPAPEEIIEKREIEGGLITTFDAEPEDAEETEKKEEDTKGDEPEAIIPEPVSRAVDLKRMTQRPILEFADQSPQIEGGIGALYLNIHYPAEALKDNAQGRTVIEFVVEEDGTTSHITVLQALHPACDSVAVSAIRGTRFVPGRQNGELVRVKMRLPIRFRLLQQGRPADTTDTGT